MEKSYLAPPEALAASYLRWLVTPFNTAIQAAVIERRRGPSQTSFECAANCGALLNRSRSKMENDSAVWHSVPSTRLRRRQYHRFDFIRFQLRSEYGIL